MKKFILRVMACFMMAAMIGTCMGNAKVAFAEEKGAFTGKYGGDYSAEWIPASAFAGCEEGAVVSFTFDRAGAGDGWANTYWNFTFIKSSWDKYLDASFYAEGARPNFSEWDFIDMNDTSVTTYTTTFSKAGVADIVAGGQLGIQVAGMILVDWTVTPVAGAADGFVALNINERPFISGLAPADNADGSVTFSGGTSMKASFMLPETLAAGESITVNVKLQFNSADDKAVRFYLIANAIDANIATDIQTITNENTGSVVEKTFVLTAASDATELLFASSSYGTYIKDVTIYDITLGDKPAKTPAAPVVTGDEYVVQAGDTLREIAKAAGVTVEELATANGIENINLIRKGVKLVIPAVDKATRHVVVAGDTLVEIAKAYGVTVADLVAANGIENPDLIVVGQAIVLP